MKELIGKTVYLLPTGNNARNSKKYKEAVITSVARVFLTYRYSGWDHDIKARFRGDYLDTGCNSGYVVYRTLDDLNDYYESVEVSERITSKFRCSSDYQAIGIERLREIAAILGV